MAPSLQALSATAFRVRPPHTRVPAIVATGFTSALLGDERTLREFVVGDHVAREIRAHGELAVLYLVNDSYDPLDERQLRIGVDKDPALIAAYRRYCGRPIAEVPDPYGCHPSYAEHFARLLSARLAMLDIDALVVDTHHSYCEGHYEPYVRIVFERYVEIERELAEKFRYRPRSLFRVQCRECHAIDDTRIVSVGPVIAYHCGHCRAVFEVELAAIRGKLNWKLDCAARWNLYRIEVEVFSKAHMAEAGTFAVARHVSERWFGGRVPAPVEYGHLRLAPDVAGRLVRALPAAALKKLLLEPLNRDLSITRGLLEKFAHAYEVRPGQSYARYVTEELPRRYLELHRDDWPEAGTRLFDEKRRTEETLVAHANEYARLMQGRGHGLRPPNPAVLRSASQELVLAMIEAITLAMRLRVAGGSDGTEVALRRELPACCPPATYPVLRRLLGQEDGLPIASVLHLLPLEYLAMVHLVLSASVQGRAETHVPARENTADDAATCPERGPHP